MSRLEKIIASYRRVHLLVKLMVGQLEVCDPLNCTALVHILSQAHQITIIRHQDKVVLKTEANSGQLSLSKWEQSTSSHIES